MLSAIVMTNDRYSKIRLFQKHIPNLLCKYDQINHHSNYSAKWWVRISYTPIADIRILIPKMIIIWISENQILFTSYVQNNVPNSLQLSVILSYISQKYQDCYQNTLLRIFTGKCKSPSVVIQNLSYCVSIGLSTRN